MKKFAAIIAALMMIAVLASAASAANNTTNATKVDIRSPVFTGSSLAATLPVNLDYTTFPGFYYDIDTNLGSESLSIDGTKITGMRSLAEDGLVYTTTPQNVAYEYSGWSGETYQKLGFLAQEYVPVNGKPDVLSKLILDDDTKYSLKVGESLDLGEGYALIPKQIDTDGKKVWLDLTKDGTIIDDQVINADTGNQTWVYEADNIGGEDDVPLMRVHVDSVFQGQTDSMVVIEGLWLISNNPLEIEDDDTFEKLEVVSTNPLRLTNRDTLNFNKNNDVKIAGDINLKVADSDDVRFYFYKTENASGEYEVRGPVASGIATWDYTSFPGFYYDIDNNVGSEFLNVVQLNGRTIPEDQLIYSTSAQNVTYEYSGWSGESYQKIGFLAQEYIPVNNQPDVLSKLILDDDTKYSLKVGESLDLGEGYALIPKQIDTDGKKVWLDLTKDGTIVDDQVINADTGNKTWVYEADNIGGEDDVPIMRVHVDSVFQGQTDSMVVIEGLWLMSTNPLEIEEDDTFGSFEVTSTNPLTLKNRDNINLNKNNDISLGNNMYFKVADSDELRYYPYAKYTSSGVTPGNETPGSGTPVGPNVTPGNGTPVGPNVTPGNGTPVGPNVTPGNGTPVGPNETPDNGTTGNESTNPIPGFEAIFAVAGLIAVAYLVRRE